MYFTEKRSENRVDVRMLDAWSRMCDITLDGGRDYRMAYLVDISKNGVRFALPEDEEVPGRGLEQGAEVMIGGCILNDFVGLLSSFKAIVRWSDGKTFGVQLQVPVDMDYNELHDLATRIFGQKEGNAFMENVDIF